MKIAECKKCGHRFYEDGIMRCPNCGAAGRKIFNVVFRSPFKRVSLQKSRELIVREKSSSEITSSDEAYPGPGEVRKFQFGLIAGKKANYTFVAILFFLALTGYILNMAHHQKIPAQPPGEAEGVLGQTKQAPVPDAARGPKEIITKPIPKGSPDPIKLSSVDNPDLKLLVPKQQGQVELLVKEPKAFLLIEPKAWESLPHRDKVLLCRNAMDFLAGFSKDHKKSILFISISNVNNSETLATANLSTKEIKIHK